MYKKLIITAIIFFLASSANALDYTDCQGRWKLSNTTYTDVSGNGNTLTATGTPDAATGHGGGTIAATYFNHAAVEYLSIADASCANLNITGSISISCWVRRAATGVYQMLVTKWGASGQYSYDLQINADNTTQFVLSSTGSNVVGAVGATALTSTTLWYHLAGVYNGTDVRLYINGVLDSNGASNPASHSSGIYDSTAAFEIGCRATETTYSMTGDIDDVAVLSRALSSSEVSELYEMGDDFLDPYRISGTLKDTDGNPIDCSTYNVRINAYPVNNSSDHPTRTLLNTAADGSFSLTVPDTDPYVVVYDYYGAYAPTDQSNIAGAKIMVGEQ